MPSRPTATPAAPQTPLEQEAELTASSGRINRRQFTLCLGAAGLLATSPAGAADTRTITTSVGTYEVPTQPQRVVAVDFRLDVEPALALGLPIIGYGVQEAMPSWIPLPAGNTYIGGPPDREAITMLNPDLIICTDIPGSEYWPIDKLSGIAPILPVDYKMNWTANLTRLGGWMGREQAAADFIAAYQAEIDAVKASRAEALQSKLVAAIWFEPENNEIQVQLREGTSNVTLAGQVLADLGGRTIDPAQLGEYGVSSVERASDVLGAVDAFMLDSDEPDRVAALEANPIWQRLPAVAAGRVVKSPGTFYGGGYSARHIIPEWNKLFALLS